MRRPSLCQPDRRRVRVDGVHFCRLPFFAVHTRLRSIRTRACKCLQTSDIGTASVGASGYAKHWPVTRRSHCALHVSNWPLVLSGRLRAQSSPDSWRIRVIVIFVTVEDELWGSPSSLLRTGHRTGRSAAGYGPATSERRHRSSKDGGSTAHPARSRSSAGAFALPVAQAPSPAGSLSGIPTSMRPAQPVLGCPRSPGANTPQSGASPSMPSANVEGVGQA
ncbi:hypothetical protein C8Q79DRAFT_663569 [Trametes meyenii]|nr:hypothetical protein C8Q79DRAFT_663569 [Trametes meyenii]